MMMSLLRWMRCFVAMTFMHTSFNYQRVDGNRDNCACYDGNGRIYNLSPLQQDNGNPRFTDKGSDGWMYSYNPCRSFWLGAKQSDCFGNVAICMWAENNSSYHNIGKQTTSSCSRDSHHRKPQLIYTNKERFPNWQAIVKLRCDPSKKTPEEAEFYFISKDNNKWVFLLMSNCACPDGCPDDPTDSCPTSPQPPADNASKLKYILPICALSLAVIAIPLFIYRLRIRRCNRGHEEDQQLLIPGNYMDG